MTSICEKKISAEVVLCQWVMSYVNVHDMSIWLSYVNVHDMNKKFDKLSGSLHFSMASSGEPAAKKAKKVYKV